MNPEQLSAEVHKYLALLDDLPSRAAKQHRNSGDRGGLLRKTPYADALTKRADEDHDPPDVGALYQRIAVQSKTLSNHYRLGAVVADTARDFDPDLAALVVLKTAGAQAGSFAERIRFETEAALAEFTIQQRAVAACRARAELSDPSAVAFSKVRRRERGDR